MTTDWSKLLLELRAKGLKAPAVAQNTGADVHTIYALIDGRTAEPKYSVGKKIKELHERLCATS